MTIRKHGYIITQVNLTHNAMRYPASSCNEGKVGEDGDGESMRWKEGNNIAIRGRSSPARGYNPSMGGERQR